MVKRRSEPELRAALAVQISALLASCSSYDQGAEWEAQRIATTVHTLVHDAGKRNVSLLTQLGVKDSLRFASSTYPINPNNYLAYTPLIVIRMGPGGGKNLPAFAMPRVAPRPLPFEEWWGREVVFQSGKGANPFVTLTRKRLVFALRNKEGGSHYDPILEDEGYIAASTMPTVWEVSGNQRRPILQLESAMMRQVAWELMETLRTQRLIT